MFIGRKNELKSLDTLYNSNKFEFTVIYKTIKAIPGGLAIYRVKKDGTE